MTAFGVSEHCAEDPARPGFCLFHLSRDCEMVRLLSMDVEAWARIVDDLRAIAIARTINVAVPDLTCHVEELGRAITESYDREFWSIVEGLT